MKVCYQFCFYRSYQTSDPKIQGIFIKDSWAKRPRKPLDPRVVDLLLPPDAQSLLLRPPPPSQNPEKPEMMDLGSQNEE